MDSNIRSDTGKPIYQSYIWSMPQYSLMHLSDIQCIVISSLCFVYTMVPWFQLYAPNFIKNSSFEASFLILCCRINKIHGNCLEI